MPSKRFSEIRDRAHSARQAARRLASTSESIRNQALLNIHRNIQGSRETLLQANQEDMQAVKPLLDRGEISKALFGRLKLDESKLDAITQGIQGIIALPDPIQRILWGMEMDEGLTLHRVSCPLGVLGVIFEARPDVIPQVMSLAVKSGNAALLKGGQEASRTNNAFFRCISEALNETPDFPADAYHLLESREDVKHLLGLYGLIDLIIPRGGNSLVKFIQENTRIPVMGHADGICHLYVDREANLEMAEKIIIDSKVQYPSACNAVETVLIHRSHCPGWLAIISERLRQNGVELFGDTEIAGLVPGVAANTNEDDWHREFGDLKIALKLASSLDEAIDHINRFGSGHTDGIITENMEHRDRFMNLVDSAGVYHNASTRFADGFRYGLGAEVGISTNKTHARGPVGLEGLTIYKYRLYGSGQIVGEYSGSQAKPFRHRRIV